MEGQVDVGPWGGGRAPCSRTGTLSQGKTAGAPMTQRGHPVPRPSFPSSPPAARGPPGTQGGAASWSGRRLLSSDHTRPAHSTQSIKGVRIQSFYGQQIENPSTCAHRSPVLTETTGKRKTNINKLCPTGGSWKPPRGPRGLPTPALMPGVLTASDLTACRRRPRSGPGAIGWPLPLLPACTRESGASSPPERSRDEQTCWGHPQGGGREPVIDGGVQAASQHLSPQLHGLEGSFSPEGLPPCLLFLRFQNVPVFLQRQKQ